MGSSVVVEGSAPTSEGGRAIRGKEMISFLGASLRKGEAGGVGLIYVGHVDPAVADGGRVIREAGRAGHGFLR